ncbi:hypothetical protein FGIG_10725 [Fasciola gigantica]|uniref:Uncharacterized protein n=1 Tax=Fasciola gigantica TaxID=46835 RepID=A0A504Z6R8_FASGI|nr:hypothetical protein FGIG_10725 [Fasciola gigantica]
MVGPDTRFLVSQPLWIAEQPNVEMKSLMRADYPGHIHATRSEVPYGLRAKSYKPKVSAYRSTLQLRTPYRSTGLMRNLEPGYTIRPEELLFDSRHQRDRLVDDRQANQCKWLSRGQIKRNDEPMERSSLYRLDFASKTLEPVRRITIKHVPLHSEEPFTGTSMYMTDFNKVSVPRSRYAESQQKTQSQHFGRYSVAKSTAFEAKPVGPSSPIQGGETPRMSTTSSYKIDYQPYAVPLRSVPLFTRRVAPQLFSRPVTNPPFEITAFGVTPMKSSYQEHYNPEGKPDAQNLPPAGSITRGGRMLSQRETYAYHKTPTPRLPVPDSHSLLGLPSEVDLPRRSHTATELYQRSLNDNMWPYLEHSQTLSFPKTALSTRSTLSVSQASHENLSQTIFGHTNPHGFTSKANVIEHPLTNITNQVEQTKSVNCQCDPDVAKIIDLEVGKAQLTKLEELHARYKIGSQGSGKETSMLTALRKHVNECLKLSSATASISDHTPLSSSGTWKATLENKPTVRSFYGQSESSSLTLRVDLPLKEVLRSISQTSSSNSMANGHPEYFDEDNETLRLNLNELLVSRKGSKDHSVPGHIQCSTIFRATGEYIDHSADQAKTSKESTSADYLTRLGDLESMPEGHLDWDKVAELERALWKENEDAQAKNFVRQSSLMTYLKVMEETMSGCSFRNQKLIEEGNKLFEEKQTNLSPEKISSFYKCYLFELFDFLFAVSDTKRQHLAHLRALMQDTSKQIEMLQKTLKKPDLFATNMTAEERARLKRWPLCTPIRCRERYARQVRVVIEMLAIMQELLERIQQPEEDGTVELFSES